MSSTPPPKTVTAYKIPLSIIQEWPPQDTINPSRVRWVTYYFAGLHAAATAVVFIRIWTRVRKRAGGFGVDDMLIIVAWFLATVMTGIAIYGIVGIGMDKHVWDTPKQSAVLGGLIAWILEQLFLASLCLTKISVLLFFRRLIDRSYSPWITIGVKYHCADRNIVDVLVGALSVFSDLYSMVIPVYIVSKVKIERKQKMVLYAVFCCGLMVIGAGGARTYYLHKVNTSQMRDLTRKLFIRQPGQTEY
ncbi:hypothetical protein EJ08DRAFT_637272 [Tothia fuscella]|uniref:Rhodopsin domain-containing protein n=1 Tax=Tothia fuscella TaxID=1048955 RepID=A0A9P4TWT4_9PEZI|nr:hypothetical protein EJ08DRAFT_637272 [Tothia fuscella]